MTHSTDRTAAPRASGQGAPVPDDVTRRLRLDDQLCFALYAATNAITRAYRPPLADIDLTYPQYLVMLVLWQNGPATVRGIADSLRLGANAVTPLIDHLEAAGYVRRSRDAADRRQVRIEPTVAGAALEQAAAVVQESVACRTGLDDRALAALRDELHALTDRLVAAPGEGADARRPEEAGIHGSGSARRTRS